MLIAAILTSTSCSKFAFNFWMNVYTSISIGASRKEFAVFSWMYKWTFSIRTIRKMSTPYFLLPYGHTRCDILWIGLICLLLIWTYLLYFLWLRISNIIFKSIFSFLSIFFGAIGIVHYAYAWLYMWIILMLIFSIKFYYPLFVILAIFCIVFNYCF